METWGSAILYAFLGYILFHLIVDDLIRLVKAYYKYKNGHPHHEQPALAATHGHDEQHEQNEQHEHQQGVETQFSFNAESTSPAEVEVDTPSERKVPRPPQLFARQLSKAEQSSLVLIVYKLCDMIMYCLAGYYHTFTVCWCACLTCLDAVMSKYFALLEFVVKSLTAFPGAVYLCITAVLCLSIGCVMIYVIVH